MAIHPPRAIDIGMTNSGQGPMRHRDVEQLKERMKRFGISVIRLADKLPSDRAAAVVANQMVRSATSAGANYRAACRARSKADFISKMGIVEEEVDETFY